MFSRIPVPKADWRPEAMRYAMACLPLVGIAVGVGVLAWNWLALTLAFGPLLRGAGLALVPLIVSGGIHLDGFCDTVDARASHADQEKKQAILKDLHVGAFAAIAVAAYLIFFAALASELPADIGIVACFSLIFVLSRVLTALATALFPCARDSGLGRIFHDAAAKKATLVSVSATGAAVAALLAVLGGPTMLAIPVGAGLLFAWFYRMVKREFGGLSGDLSGWFLQVCELLSLALLIGIVKA